MDESERIDFELLVKILDEELEAQFAIDRAHDTEATRRLFAFAPGRCSHRPVQTG